MHFLNIVRDEICAAGLEGIPLSNLWMTLKEPVVEFPISIDDDSVEFLWNKLKAFKDIDFFVRSHEPPPYVYFNRFESLASEDMDFYYVPNAAPIVKRFYPVKSTSVFGSCEDYETRLSVKKEILIACLSYKDAFAKWGTCLVAVASQRLRNVFLTGSEIIASSINPKLYRILELIAKSRYNGIPTSGPDGILNYGESSSTIFYFRKLFKSDGYIQSQPFIARDISKKTLRRTTLLHSFRFFRVLPYPLALMLQKLSNKLESISNHMMLPCTVRQNFSLGRRQWIRILKFGETEGCLKLINLPFSTACALINIHRLALSNTDELSEEWPDMALEIMQRENAATGSSEGENIGRRYLREASVVCLQKPFNLEAWKIKQSQLDADTPMLNAISTDDTVDLDKSNLEQAQEELHQIFDSSPFYAPNINIEDSFSTQVCRYLTGEENKPNTRIASHFNLSQKLTSRYTDALAGIGKLLTSKISSGSAFSLVRRYITEKEAKGMLRVAGLSTQSSGTSMYNLRQQRRAFVLSRLAALKVFPSIVALRQVIWAEEARLGMKGKMDRKSLQRIMDDLVKEKAVKYIVMQIGTATPASTTTHVDEDVKRPISQSLELKLICHPSVEMDTPELIDCVLQEKQRLTERHTKPSYTPVSAEEALANDQLNMLDDEPTVQSSDPSPSTPLNVQAITKKELELIRLPDKNISRLRRRSLMHQFLYYMAYERPRNVEPGSLQTDSWAPVCNKTSVTYRYVPSSQLPGLLPGWLSTHEMIRQMPLGLFLAISAPASAPRLLLQWLNVMPAENLRPTIRQLLVQQRRQAAKFSPFAARAKLAMGEAHLDAIRRFELLRTPLYLVPFPGGTRGSLYAWVLSRYNFTRIFSVIEQLSGQGLLTLLVQPIQANKPTADLYVHKRASLLDTRFAAPAHHIITDTSLCHLLQFEFKSGDDVDSYWLNFRAIMLFTPIGFLRFADPSLVHFMDIRPPLLKVLHPSDTEDKGQLPQIAPTYLKSPKKDSDMGSRVLLGIGGLHGALYTHKSPFDEIAYGCGLQGECTQYEPIHPTPSLLQPALRTKELRGILGCWEPAIKTTGDGAFWPWTVQMFFNAVPVTPLISPPKLPGWLFANRTRRFPFLIDGDVPEHLKASRTLRSSSDATHALTESRYHLRTSRKNVSGGESGNSDEADESSYTDASSFDDLQNVGLDRQKRLLRKRTIMPHINRRAFKRNYALSDRRALDERDVEIRKSLLYRRASWSKLEDQMLLTCRVSSLFLVGHTREYVCIPYVIVRDILYQYLPVEAGDKTSLACARRLKFLLMLRNADRTRADILLTQASSHPELLSKYNIGKVTWVNLFNKDNLQAYRLFKDLVAVIVKNFVPDLREKCGHAVNTTQLLASNVTSLALQGVDQENEKKTQEDEKEIQDEEDKKTSYECGEMAFSREWLLSCKCQLRNKYDFILLASVSNDLELPDIGHSRPAIVSEALRNLLLGAVRLEPEINSPHNSNLLNRILKQYPYEQLNHAVKALATTDSLRKVKSFEESDLEVFGHFQMKITLRLLTWCNCQLFVYIRFFTEAMHITNQVLLQPTTPAIGVPSAHRGQIIRHNFSSPTSGGLVAIFFEFLYCLQDVSIYIEFDMSSISLLTKPCVSLEDRQAAALEFSPLSSLPSKRKKMASDEETLSGLAARSFGESTHIGMTMSLLETPLISSKIKSSEEPRDMSKSLSESLMDSILAEVDGHRNGKTPRIDIRLSLNGGAIVATQTENILTLSPDKTAVVSGELEHREICKRVLKSFLEPLNWHPSAPATTDSTLQRDIAPEYELRRSCLDFILSGLDLGCTLVELVEKFGDKQEITDLVKLLVEEKQIFLLGLTEARYVHRSCLRLWLVHVKDPKKKKNKKKTGKRRAAAAAGIKRRRLATSRSITASTAKDWAFTNDSSEVELANSNDTGDEKCETNDAISCTPTDYYFLPQPWLTEAGQLKTTFFMHLIQSTCAMISRLSGSSMHRLAREHRHLLSLVSFRHICILLHELRLIHLVRVIYSGKCSLFSKPNEVTFSSENVLLAPSSELVLNLEPKFVSRVSTLFECLAEVVGHRPNDATPFTSFSRCRTPLQSTVLKRKTNEDEEDDEV